MLHNINENKLIIEKYKLGLLTENKVEDISRNIVKISQENNILKKI